LFTWLKAKARHLAGPWFTKISLSWVQKKIFIFLYFYFIKLSGIKFLDLADLFLGA